MRGTTTAVALTLLALLAGDAWLWRAQERHLLNQIEEELGAIAELKAHQVADWRNDQLAEGRALTNNPSFARAVFRFLHDSNPDDEERVRSRFLGLRERGHFADVLLVALDHHVRLSLSGRTTLRRSWEKALAFGSGHGAVLTDLDLEVGGTPAIGIAVIAFLPEPGGSDERPASAIILQIDARQFLYPLIQRWPTPSTTAETLLVRRDGDDVLFLNNVRRNSDAALKLRFPLSRTDLPAVKAVRGERGVVYGTDYGGRSVAAVVQSVPGSPWFMVAKMDSEEVFAEWRSRAGLIIGLLVTAIALTLAAAVAVRQRAQKAHLREIYEAEVAHRAALERHAVVLRSIGDAVIATDAGGRVELLNPVAEALTGWTSEEAVGRPLADVFRVVSEDTRLPVEDFAARVLRDGVAEDLAARSVLIARDGTERPVADGASPIRNERAETTGAVLVFRDRTRERQAETERGRAVAEYERLAIAIHQAAEVVMITDAGGIIQYVNPAFESVTGFSRLEAIGQNPRILSSGKHGPDFYAQLWEMISSGQSWQGRLVNKRKDGTLFVEDATISPVRDATGTVVSYVAVKRDVTRELDLQTQLFGAQKMESVGRLAGGVAHDFNNMLGVILGNAELAMARADVSDSLRDELEEIHQAALRSASLTGQLLAFARRQTIEPRVLDLNDAVAGMLKMLRRLIGEDIALAWVPGAALWPVLVDPTQLDQVLANLLVNARDAIGAAGRVTIETSNVAIDPEYCATHAGFRPGEYAMLAVSDDGQGMTREVLDHLFEPFFTTKAQGVGTGLGLATVYGIVKQNNGFINVYSEVGHGATFRIYLPRCADRVRAAEVAAPEPIRGTGETILLVEDEGSILRMSVRMLEQLGYNVLAAGGPTEALSLAREPGAKIDLLMTDVVMPEMDGLQLVTEVRALLPEIKWLFASGYTAETIARRGVLEEGTHYLPKPFSIRDLASKVREALGRG
jgi:PAS domain S-box-containing protein